MGGDDGDVRNLNIDSRLIDYLIEKGIENLHPPQIEAIAPALSGRNLLLATPTASGKSLVAYLAILNRLRTAGEGARAFYIVPLKALASEKVDDLRELCSKVDMSVGLAVGDREGETGSIDDADIVVCTSEKLDSLLRNRPTFAEKVEIVVADEFHLIDEPSRGPTLEVLLARLRHLRPEAQRIALSATVGNPKELAAWMEADLVESDWRPVTLQYGTLTGLELDIHRAVGPNEDIELPKSRTLKGSASKITDAILEDTISIDGQILLFVSTRASAEKEARELGKRRLKTLNRLATNESKEEISKLEILATSLTRGDDATSLTDRLATAIRGGVAFHHAGLTSRQRSQIETAFKDGLLKALCATPTLAAGVNLPARRVIIRDWKRWNGGRYADLSVMEIQQMQGRAGRPQYDDSGEAWVMAKTESDRDKIIDAYIFGFPEDIQSKLANPLADTVEEDPALLTHILASIASVGLTDRDALRAFFEQTLLARQIDKHNLHQRIDRMIEWLVQRDMILRTGESNLVAERIASRPINEEIEENWEDELPTWAAAASALDGLDWIKREMNDPTPKRKGPAVFGFTTAASLNQIDEVHEDPANMTYAATPFGETISRLYLNPVTGYLLRIGLRTAVRIAAGLDDRRQLTPTGLIHLVTTTPDFLPMWVKSSEANAIEDRAMAIGPERLLTSSDLAEVNSRQGLDVELGQIKALTVLESWINECTIRDIEKEHGAQPGDVRTRIDLADWLLYASRRMLSSDEQANLDQPDATAFVSECIAEIQRRVRYGVRAELLGLVGIRGIGRVRAREMYHIGLEDPHHVAEMGPRDRKRLEDLRGWSPRLVDNTISNAQRLLARRR